MKLTIHIIQVEMGMIANRLIWIALLFVSCKSSEATYPRTNDLYEIIELQDYSDNALYFKTIPFESMSYSRKLDYEGINEYNFKRNWVLENERFVNFDTIFNENQRKQINRKFRSLKRVKLDSSELDNPKILSKVQNNEKGNASVSFPFIQKSIDGTLYAFIFRSWYRNHSGESILYIYKLTEGQWAEFAKVPYGIS